MSASPRPASSTFPPGAVSARSTIRPVSCATPDCRTRSEPSCMRRVSFGGLPPSPGTTLTRSATANAMPFASLTCTLKVCSAVLSGSSRLNVHLPSAPAFCTPDGFSLTRSVTSASGGATPISSTAPAAVALASRMEGASGNPVLSVFFSSASAISVIASRDRTPCADVWEPPKLAA